MLTEYYLTQIDQLTDRERTMFLYRLIFKLSYQNIARRLHISEKNVSKLCQGIKTDIEFAKWRKELFDKFEISSLL